MNVGNINFGPSGEAPLFELLRLRDKITAIEKQRDKAMEIARMFEQSSFPRDYSNYSNYAAFAAATDALKTLDNELML